MSGFIYDFQTRIKESGDEPYILFEDTEITYREFGEEVWRVANGLLQEELETGDKVAIMMDNSPQWLFTYFALREINATAVPVNIELRGSELEYVLSNSDAKAVFLDKKTVGPYTESSADIGLEVLLNSDRPDMRSFEEFKSEDGAPPNVKEPEDYVAHILYTSGTTGRPKGVVNRPNRDRDGNPVYELLKDQLGWTSDDVLYTCWPLYHGNALALSAMPAFYLGATLALDRNFTASGFWDRINHYGATEFHTLGAVNKILLKQPEREDDDNNPVRVVLTAGMPGDAWEEFEERFDVKIKEFYAAVDGPALFANLDDKVGSMGTPMFCEAKIVDDDGNELGPNEVGELWVRSPDGERTFEYYKRPEATEEAHEGSWFKTGDLVYKDEDDYYYFVDRKKYTVRRMGENISTFEVERSIEEHPGVREACVYGIPSELGEDDVATKIIPQEDGSIDPPEILDFLQGRIAEFEMPKYIEITDHIPKTPTDRYKKMELSEEGVTDAMWRNPEVA